jgi:hypothetical protein
MQSFTSLNQFLLYLGIGLVTKSADWRQTTGLDLQNNHYSIFIDWLDIFSFICATDKVWITELILIHKRIKSVRNVHAQVYRSIWHYDVIDKSNNISSEGLDRHYHKYPEILSNNVCLDLQNSHYSICIFVYF